MRGRVRGIGWVVGALLVAGVAGAGEVTPLKDRDVVVFAGDSLTEHGQRRGGYVKLVEEALIERLPHLKIDVIGAGKGWDTVRGLRTRFDEDVLSHQPTIVVIEIGINDLCEEGSGRDVAKKIWRLGLQDLVWRVKKTGARPVLTTLTVVGERQHGTNTYDALLDTYSEIIREVGAEKECQVIELQKPFVAYLATNNPAQKYEGILTTDGAHLSDRGNRLFADTVLEALGVPPATAGTPPLAEAAEGTD